MTNLNGKTALITGSTSGIGLGVAQQLAQQQCRIILNGFGEPSAIQAIRHQLQQTSGQEALFWDVDLSDGQQIQQRWSELPQVDILVNNAGIQHTAPVTDFPLERWNSILALNLTAAFCLIQKALPAMQERRWGRIINIASAHGLVASVHKAAYVAAKHGLIGLTKVVALEQAGQGVTCNAVCPGWVLTPLVRKQIEDRAQANGQTFDQAKELLLKEKQPSGQFTTPEQLGDLVLFLCSQAADNLTGASLPVDGGWTAQ